MRPIKKFEQNLADALSQIKVGYYLYSDFMFGKEISSERTVIAVVGYVNAEAPEGKRLTLVAMKDAPDALHWAKEYGVTGASWDVYAFNGRENSHCILQFGADKPCLMPTVEYCDDFFTEGTEAGNWYLPSIAELRAVRENMQAVNVALLHGGGDAFDKMGFYASSSEFGEFCPLCLPFDEKGYVYKNKGKMEYFNVRPMMSF